MGELVYINDVIEMLNNTDKYISGSLMLESNNKVFPSNEVFIVDDVYEGLETIRRCQKKECRYLFHGIMKFLLHVKMKKKSVE